MELRINLATATLKDAEHAIFLIGAYFGLTNLPSAPTLTGATLALVPPAAAAVETPVPPSTTNQPPEPPAAAVFATPGALPPGAGESPSTADPAQVFAGNGPGPALAAPQGMPGTPTPGLATGVPSAPTVAGPVGSPAAPVPAPAASALPVYDLDAAGLPWDNRIHASGEGGAKPKNADGKWRKKRGLNDAAFVGKIEAELRATMAAPRPGPPATPAAPVAPAAPAAPPPAPTAPPAASSQPASGAAPSAPVGPPTTFEQLMPRITAAVMAGTLPQTALLQAVTAYQLPNIPALAQRPDLVATVWAYLQSMYPALV